MLYFMVTLIKTFVWSTPLMTLDPPPWSHSKPTAKMNKRGVNPGQIWRWNTHQKVHRLLCVAQFTTHLAPEWSVNLNLITILKRLGELSSLVIATKRCRLQNQRNPTRLAGEAICKRIVTSQHKFPGDRDSTTSSSSLPGQGKLAEVLRHREHGHLKRAFVSVKLFVCGGTLRRWRHLTWTHATLPAATTFRPCLVRETWHFTSHGHRTFVVSDSSLGISITGWHWRRAVSSSVRLGGCTRSKCSVVLGVCACSVSPHEAPFGVVFKGGRRSRGRVWLGPVQLPKFGVPRAQAPPSGGSGSRGTGAGMSVAVHLQLNQTRGRLSDENPYRRVCLCVCVCVFLSRCRFEWIDSDEEAIFSGTVSGTEQIN